MSAIFGIWNINGDPVKEAHIQKMNGKVAHYGKDAQDILVLQNIGMGCCLNNIGKYSQQDVPVFYDESQEIMLVSDALIYNRDELIKEHSLSDHKNISTQDLLFEAYKRWGEDCPKYINGDFAFAVWEKRKKQLLVIRDHLGVRPLYYFYNKSIFSFATDYRALLALPFVGLEIDEKMMYASINKILSFYPEATHFANIRALPQSNVLRINEQGIHRNKYWTPGKNAKILYKTEEEYTKALYSIVNDAIKIRIHSTEKKIASELSGGLDSSVITIIANRELADRNVGMEVFSWSPPFEYMQKLLNDERVLLEKVCQQENLSCTFFDPSIPSNNNNELLPPGAGDAAIILQECETMAQHGVTVILSGWGGDQGISHRANLFELLLTGCWGYFLKEIKHLAKGSPLRFIKLLLSNTILQLFTPYSYLGIPDKDIINFINKDFWKKAESYRQKEILYFSISPVKHLESGYIQTRTEQAAWMDAVYSIQHLYPFLDYRVVDFAMSIPRHLYFKNGTSRYIFRQAFEQILPRDIYQFTSKNDIAKSTYFTNSLQKTLTKIIQVVNCLDRDIFSDYIDFKKLVGKLDNLAANDKKNILLMKRRILSCYNLQRILKDTKKDFV
ncbi:MAG: asparagine synthase-related protein [Candidatus Ozemobacteraceae bacterium]